MHAATEALRRITQAFEIWIDPVRWRKHDDESRKGQLNQKGATVGPGQVFSSAAPLALSGGKVDGSSSRCFSSWQAGSY